MIGACAVCGVSVHSVRIGGEFAILAYWPDDRGDIYHDLHNDDRTRQLSVAEAISYAGPLYRLHECGSGRRLIKTSVSIEYRQDVELRELHRRTRIPMAEFIRQGIDLALETHKDKGDENP